jgi:MoxR-like ATPase
LRVKPARRRSDAARVKPPTTVHDLKALVQSFHPVIAFDTAEEERVEKLADAVAAELNLPVFVWTLTSGLYRKPGANGTINTTVPAELFAHMRTLSLEAVFLLKDVAKHLDDPAVCRSFREAAQQFSGTRSSMWIVGTPLAFPADVKHHVVHFPIELPTQRELAEIVTLVARGLKERMGAKVELTKPELERLLDALSGLTTHQARQAVAAVMMDDGRLDAGDIQKLVDTKAKLLGEDGLLEYYPAEDNTWELGGFARLRAWLDRARVGFSAEAAELGLPAPRGILLAGVQGCGKSLAAKAIARSWTLPLLKLDAGRLYDKYIGESEKNLRRAIQLAEAMAPCVLWIDELEKSFASFGEGGLDGGVSQRIFATLLTWLQEKKKPVFVIATANDVFELPPELMRKGRFDELFFVDLPQPAERQQIFQIHLRRKKQDPARLDLAALVAASEGMSGAEIEQAVISALLRSLHERRALDTALVTAELASTVPLSRTRAEDVERLRELARGRFVPVA